MPDIIVQKATLLKTPRAKSDLDDRDFRPVTWPCLQKHRSEAGSNMQRELFTMSGLWWLFAGEICIDRCSGVVQALAPWALSQDSGRKSFVRQQASFLLIGAIATTTGRSTRILGAVPDRIWARQRDLLVRGADQVAMQNVQSECP
jgi:hypothetical protein